MPVYEWEGLLYIASSQPENLPFIAEWPPHWILLRADAHELQATWNHWQLESSPSEFAADQPMAIPDLDAIPPPEFTSTRLLRTETVTGATPVANGAAPPTWSQPPVTDDNVILLGGNTGILTLPPNLGRPQNLHLPVHGRRQPNNLNPSATGFHPTICLRKCRIHWMRSKFRNWNRARSRKPTIHRSRVSSISPKPSRGLRPLRSTFPQYQSRKTFHLCLAKRAKLGLIQPPSALLRRRKKTPPVKSR